MELENCDGTYQTIATQLIFSASDKKITESNLAAILETYFDINDSEKRCYQLILLTNKKMELNSRLFQINFKLKNQQNFDIEIDIIKCETNPIVETGGRCYKFQVVTKLPNSEDNEEKNSILRKLQIFLKKFYLYANQKYESEMIKILSSNFKSMFACSDYYLRPFFEFVKNWNRREEEKSKLTKKLIGKLLVLLMSTIHKITSTPVNIKRDLLRKAMSEFDITFSKQVVQLWNDTSLEDVEIDDLVKKYELNKFDDLDGSKLLWLTNKCPLIVSGSVSLWRIIETFALKNIIVIGDTSVDTNMSHLKTLRDLLEILPDIYYDILRTFTISLQGGDSVPLEYLLNFDEEFDKIVTMDKLSKMAEDTLRVGGFKEELPDVHVKRNISINTVDVEFFKISNEDTAIIISDLNDCLHLENSSNEYQLVDFNEFDKDLKIKIFAKKHKGPVKEFPENSNFHHFRVTKNGLLEIIQTKGDAFSLEKYRNLSYIQTSDFCENCIYDGISIICAEPGMGKSILAKDLKNNLDSNFWKIIVSAYDVSKILNQENDFFDYLIEMNSDDSFEKDVIEIFRKNHRIIFIWDGIDELSDQHLEKALDIISRLAEQEFPQIVTSRSHLKEKLERRFHVYAKTIQPFSEDEQTTYIRKSLESKFLHEMVPQILHGIKLRLKQLFCKGVPLEIYMLTEIFYHNTEKYLQLNDTFTLVSLFKYFVHEKFFKNKDNPQKMDQLISEHDQRRAELALQSSIKDDNFNVLSEILTGEIKVADEPHKDRSVSEFFIAMYFFKNYDKIPHLKDVLFKPRYNNIRFMFDLLMAEENTPHLAVLHKNFSLLNCNPNIKDCGGRTVLHLLFSWEIIDIILKRTEKNLDCIHSLEKFDLEEKDNLFNMNPLEYADLVIFNTNESTLIHKAAEGGNIDLLEKWLSTKNANKIDKNGLTPLHVASLNGKEKSVLVLIKAGAELNMRCPKGWTPLYYAFRRRHFNVAKYLLDNGADINLTYENKSTLLHMACENNLQEFVQLCLNYKTNVLALTENYRLAPYLVSNIHKKNDIFQLLEQEIDIVREIQENLFQACANGDNSEIKKIIEKFPYLLYTQSLHERLSTPLHMASNKGLVKTVKLLLDLESEIHTNHKESTRYIDVTNRFGKTALHLACEFNHSDVVNVLLENDPDLKIASSLGDTVLHLAHHNSDIVKRLIESGADINATNNSLETTLHIACKSGNDKTVNTLLALGAKIDTFDNRHFTPLCTAIFEKKEAIELMLFAEIFNTTGTEENLSDFIKVLIDKKVDLNAVGVEGFSILHRTSYKGDTELTKLLLKNGAKVNCVDKLLGWTPLHFTCSNTSDYSQEIAHDLIESGADVNKTENRGCTPLSFARANGCNGIVNLLIKSGAKDDKNVEKSYTNYRTWCHNYNKKKR